MAQKNRRHASVVIARAALWRNDSQSGRDFLDLRLAAIRSFPAFESEPKKRALGAVAGARENWFAGDSY
jgi:hypothetical protein